MIRKPRWFTPGPTSPLPQAQAAEAAAMLHHHSPAYAELLAELRQGLKYFFRTDHDVLVLTCSGTGAMEAAVVNTVQPGDDLLVLNAGRFGARWAAIGRAFGAGVQELTVEPGFAHDPAQVKAVLAGMTRCRAVFMQGCETSTGTLQPVREIAALVRQRADCLLVLDAVSMLGAHELEPDAWGVDVMLGASQKALAMAPGLAFVSMSPRSLERARGLKMPRYYFDLVREHDAQAALRTTFTPALSLMAGCAAALRWLRQTTLETLIDNARLLAGMTRAAVTALELKLLSRCPADSVTAVEAPPAISAQKISENIEKRFGACVGLGQDSLRNRVFRLSHLGYCDYMETLGLIGALEEVLACLGMNVEPGRALSAAQKYFGGCKEDAS